MAKTSGYYNPLFDTGMPTNYWEGIVAPRDVWERDEELVNDRSELKNWGYRVKVRIEGVHPADKNVLPDDQLPWIRINGSTAGSGHKRTGLSIGVTQGSRVWGIWGNLAKKEDPIHIGVIPNNDQLLLPKTQPANNGFLPFSGYLDTDLVSSYSIHPNKGNPLEAYFQPNTLSLSDIGIDKDGKIKFPLQSPQDCEKVPLSGISKQLQEFIQKVEQAQEQLDTWESAADKWIADKQKWISDKAAKAQEFISTGLKWIFKEIRKFVEEEINKQVKNLVELVNPPDRDKVKEANDGVIELIVCLFNKLIANLGALVGSFLSEMLDRYINVPACAVENFLGSLLGNLLGALTGAIDSIISSLSGLLGGAFSLAGSILDFLSALAGFFSCDDDQECPETKEWSIFDGAAPPVTLDFDSIINSAKSIAENATGLVDINNIANLDFSDLIDSAISAANSCNIGPVFCGAPSVTFWGAGGSGATGNVIVSAAGDILGVDLIASGLGYTKAPFVDISDNCGQGSGVNATAIVEPDGGTTSTGEPTYRVVQVVINDPGGGYLARPNGDLGGDGRVWAPADWTVVRRNDGRWNRYPPETPIETIDPQPGDEVLLPEDRVVSEGGIPITPGIYPGGQGGGINDLGIGDDFDDRLARLRGTTTIPGTGNNGATDINAFPTLDIGSYPIILYLCDLKITNAGINYSSDDEIVIEPSNGAEVIANFGPFGVLDSVRIVKTGKGWVERPEIYVKSETGYNARLTPVFCVDRIGDDIDGNLPDDPLFAGVISIVNCVGKIIPDEHNGFINGRPYYGPVHVYRGKKMMGQTHTNRDHPVVWDSVALSLKNYDERFRWVGQSLVKVVERVTNPVSGNSSNIGY
jgi:hypothetical protein